MQNSDDVGKFFEKALRCESDTLIKNMTRRRVTRRQKNEACPALVVGTKNVLSLYFLYNSFYNKKVNNIITFQNFNVLETHFLQLIKSVYCVHCFCAVSFLETFQNFQEEGGCFRNSHCFKGTIQRDFRPLFFYNSNLLGH